MDLLDALEHAAGRSARLAEWASCEPVLAGLDAISLRAVLSDDRPPVAYDRKDALLAALVRLAATDPDAGLTIVACLVPGLRAMLARHGGPDREEATAELVAALWHRIARYPLDRRPHRIAANLLLDALHDLTHRPTPPTTVPLGHAIDRAAPEQGWSPGLILDGARRAGILNHTDTTLIAATRLAGHHLRQVGSNRGLSYHAARKRRQRAERRLAAWWMPERHDPAGRAA
jgi:hypothetical protein